MRRIVLYVTFVLFGVFVTDALAQPGRSGFGRGPGVRGGPGGDLPEVGTILPDVTVYNDKGDELAVRELRGNYSVLVFGCLT